VAYTLVFRSWGTVWRKNDRTCFSWQVWLTSVTAQVSVSPFHHVAHCCTNIVLTTLVFCSLCPRPIREGEISVAFVCPSVCPSIAYIANNLRTQRPSMPKFRRMVLHLRWELHTSFKVKRSKFRVTRPLMLTDIMCHIFRTARPTNFKLGVQMEDDDPHQPQSPGPPRSKVRVARSCDQSESCWPSGTQWPYFLLTSHLICQSWWMHNVRLSDYFMCNHNGCQCSTAVTLWSWST